MFFNKSIFSLAALIAVFYFSTQSAYAVSANLLENPSVETGTSAGWTLAGNCPLNSNLYGNNNHQGCIEVQGGGHGDSYHFATSYDWGAASQEIDLGAKGYSTEMMDTLPTITASAYIGGDNGQYEFKVILRDASHNTLDTYTTGVTDAQNGWNLVSHTITGYHTGVRYIYVEARAMDGIYWAGHWGPSIDDLSLTIADVTLGGCSTVYEQIGNKIYATTCGTTSLYQILPEFILHPVTAPSVENDPVATSVSATFSTTTDVGLIKPVVATSTAVAAPVIITPASVKFVFKNDLYLGIENADVKELQKYLNTHGFPIATSGPGSLGNETARFGNLTKIALMKFQKLNGIVPTTGFFGPKTREVVNR